MNKSSIIFITLLLALWTGKSCAQEFSFDFSSGSGIFEKFSNYYYGSFILEKPVTVKIHSKIPLGKIEISPKHENTAWKVSDNNLIIRLNSPCNKVIRINDTIKLFLFAEQQERKTDLQEVNITEIYGVDNTGKVNETQKIRKALRDIAGSGKILSFPQGKYKTGQLEIYSYSRIYLAPGAEIFADTTSAEQFSSNDDLKTRRLIYINKSRDIEIFGNGTINGNGHILRQKYGDDARIRLFLAARSRNISVSGIKFKDPGSWNTQVISCENVSFNNVKLLNDVNLANTDGFDPDASRRVVINKCFASCGDDNVAIKSTNYSNLGGNVDDITIRGCVFLTKKSSLKIGTETRCDSIKNIIFENNDVIECDRGIAVYVQDGAILENISFLNNRFERNYPDAQRKAIHIAVNKRTTESQLGSVKSLLIKDCKFYTRFPEKSEIKFEGDFKGISATIENLTIEEKTVTQIEEADIRTVNALIYIH